MTKEVKSLDSLGLDVIQNASDSAVNAAGIATNVSNIAQNTADIAGFIEPPAIAGWKQSGKIYVKDNTGVDTTHIDITSLTIGGWRRVGPTGSANVWSALNVLPVGTEWIEVSVNIGCFGATNADVYQTVLYVREGGSASVSVVPRGESTFTNRSGLAERDRNVATFRIPVNAAREFDAYWTELGTTNSALINMFLGAFGVA